jgi:hypothetical protein
MIRGAIRSFWPGYGSLQNTCHLASYSIKSHTICLSPVPAEVILVNHLIQSYVDVS